MGPLKDKKLLIFDCDGVLFDSYRANIAFFNHCLAQAGHPPLAGDQLDRVAYLSTRQLAHELIPDHGEAERLFRISQETDYTPFIPNLAPLFDFEEVLGPITKTYRTAIASNRGKSLDRLVIHFGLARWFAYRVSTLDAEPKPRPDMLLKCLDHFGVEKDDAVYLGDSPADHEAAVRAGIDFLRVGGGASDIDSVKNLPALLV
jgi:phosphoglycolate phosphatase